MIKRKKGKTNTDTERKVRMYSEVTMVISLLFSGYYRVRKGQDYSLRGAMPICRSAPGPSVPIHWSTWCARPFPAVRKV